jgi:hypothetical protein
MHGTASCGREAGIVLEALSPTFRLRLSRGVSDHLEAFGIGVLIRMRSGVFLSVRRLVGQWRLILG